MEKGSTTERAEIIAYLKTKDVFFVKINFDAYSLDELKNFKRRWDDEVISSSNKNRSK